MKLSRKNESVRPFEAGGRPAWSFSPRRPTAASSWSAKGTSCGMPCPLSHTVQDQLRVQLQDCHIACHSVPSPRRLTAASSWSAKGTPAPHPALADLLFTVC